MSRNPSEMLLIGAHISGAGGLHNALWEGKNIGATTIQLFTSNQKQWAGKKLSEEDIAKWDEAIESTGLKSIMSHDSYLINLGSAKPDLLEKSKTAFVHELARCHLLGITFLNFHPGAATTSSEEECLNQILDSLLSMEKHCSKGMTRLLLETTAGQGTSVGYRFEHLGYLIDNLKNRIPIGVCIDTCHIFVAGYDISTPQGWEETLKEFDQKIGLEHLYAFHLNDSIKPLGSKVDRHAPLGEGTIGMAAFSYLMTHPKLRELPKYLETPGGPPLWKEEIALLRKIAGS